MSELEKMNNEEIKRELIHQLKENIDELELNSFIYWFEYWLQREIQRSNYDYREMTRRGYKPKAILAAFINMKKREFSKKSSLTTLSEKLELNYKELSKIIKEYKIKQYKIQQEKEE